MPHVELPQVEFKVVLLGDSYTGKTSLVLRLVEGHYRDGRSATVGAFFLTKRLTLDKMTCKLLLWDTAGQEQFQRLAVTYYRHAAAAIVCFDVSRTASEQLPRLQAWLDQIHNNLASANHRIVLCIAACKCDLPASPGIQEQAQALAERYGALYVETSAKCNEGVMEAFLKTADQVLLYQQEALSGRGRPIPVTLGGMSSPRKRAFSPLASRPTPTTHHTPRLPPPARNGMHMASSSTSANDNPLSSTTVSSTTAPTTPNSATTKPPLQKDATPSVHSPIPNQNEFSAASDTAMEAVVDEDLGHGSHVESPKMMCDSGILVCGAGHQGSDCIIL